MAVVLALLSSLMWGTADFAGGSLTRRRPALAVTGFSQAAGLVLVAVAALVARSWEDPSGYLGWGVLAGLAGLVGLVSFYVALSIGTMGVVSPIAATGVVVPVAAGLAQGERPAVLALVGIGVALVGIVLASGPELKGRAGPRPLLLAGVAAGAFGATLFFISRGSESSVVMTMLTMRVTSVSVLVLLGLALRSVGGVRPADTAPLIVIGVFDVGANLTFGAASTFGLVSLVAVLGSVYPVVTALLARVVHAERLARVQYVGVAAALTGVAMIAGG